MPLQLGDVSTDRPHVITYDPAVHAQVQEALQRRVSLEAQGYRVSREEPGELVLDPPAANPNHGVFRILSQNGDDRIVWDRTDPSQVREAFAKFKELLAKGYTAFATLATGKKGHKITEFDPGLQEILMIPSTIPG